MLKAEARKLYRNKRKDLSGPEKAKSDDLLLIQFQTVQLPFVHTLLTYWPIEENHEPDTHLFTGYIEFKNPALKILYPQSDFSKNGMRAIEVNVDTAFKLSKHNIHEPVDGIVVQPAAIDLIFVPMLISDKEGYRIGYGKGFYDKYLDKCREDFIKVGFCYFDPIDKIDDRHEF
ncbi:MAG: 5-formyltetrahydrofolate cyclo-ligase, partial [Chitinophagaceae bacterium]|nr:5-formyltetrahydrofolate cyclo-ligase [Chitinophagaceae bacterium]